MAVFQTPAGSPLLGRMDAVRQANTPQAVTSTTAKGQPFGPGGSGTLEDPRFPTMGKPEIQEFVRYAANQFDVPYELALSLLEQESSYRQNIVSEDGAVGLMQLMPGTAKAFGVTDPKEPRQNIFAGVKYFSDLIKRYDGNVELAIAAYNAGPTAVANADYRIPDIGETRRHVDDVMTGASRIRVNETNQGIWERNRLNREARERGDPGLTYHRPITPATNMDRYYQRNPDLAEQVGWTGDQVPRTPSVIRDGPSLTQQFDEELEARNPTSSPLLDAAQDTALIAGSAYGGGRLATGAYGAARGLAAPVVRSAAGRLGNLLTGTGTAARKVAKETVDQGRREFTNRMGQIILGTSLAAQPLSQMAQRVASSPAAQNVALKGKELAGKFGEVNKMANALRSQWQDAFYSQPFWWVDKKLNFPKLENLKGMGLRVLERGKYEKDAVLRAVGDTLEVVATKSRPMTEAMFRELVQLPNGPKRQKIVEMLDDASYRTLREYFRYFPGRGELISREAVRGTTVGQEALRNMSKFEGYPHRFGGAFRKLPEATQKWLENASIWGKDVLVRFGGSAGRSKLHPGG